MGAAVPANDDTPIEKASESNPVARRWRSPWTFVLRLAVSAGLLAVLITKIDFGTILPRHHTWATFVYLTGAFAAAAGGVVLSAWRWQRVLAVFDVRAPLRTLTNHYFAGLFVGNVLPSTIGGDVLRVSRGTKTFGSAETSFASAALERLTGFVALPLWSVLGFLVRPSLLDGKHAWLAILTDGVTVGTLATLLVLAAHPKVAGRFLGHENWTRFIGAIHVGVDRMRREPRHAANVVGAALCYQASTIVSVWCGIHALGVSVPNAAVLAFVPAVAMAQVLPLSVNGLGVREGMLVLLLAGVHVASGRAVGIGLLWYATMLLVSLLGAPAFAVGGRKRETVPAGQPS